ncbi:hypothetical protein KIF59_21065 [Enterobacter cloacae subsp. cloacae]|nr:hypothetical protein [Enterobacter cloacae subsp. cloacae]
MNYKSLINPLNTTVEKTLLGQKVYLRRLTSAELDDYNDKVEAGRPGPGFHRETVPR